MDVFVRRLGAFCCHLMSRASLIQTPDSDLRGPLRRCLRRVQSHPGTRVRQRKPEHDEGRGIHAEHPAGATLMARSTSTNQHRHGHLGGLAAYNRREIARSAAGGRRRRRSSACQARLASVLIPPPSSADMAARSPQTTQHAAPATTSRLPGPATMSSAARRAVEKPSLPIFLDPQDENSAGTRGPL